jgi:hypothetical protein
MALVRGNKNGTTHGLKVVRPLLWARFGTARWLIFAVFGILWGQHLPLFSLPRQPRRVRGKTRDGIDCGVTADAQRR